MDTHPVLMTVLLAISIVEVTKSLKKADYNLRFLSLAPALRSDF